LGSLAVDAEDGAVMRPEEEAPPSPEAARPIAGANRSPARADRRSDLNRARASTIWRTEG
jgi:hypothetical protein